MQSSEAVTNLTKEVSTNELPLKQTTISTLDNSKQIDNHQISSLDSGIFKLPFTKVMSFQKSFSNVNGKPQINTKKIISDGQTGKMYQNIDGKEQVSELNSDQLSDEFKIPGIDLGGLFSTLNPNSFKSNDLNNQTIPNLFSELNFSNDSTNPNSNLDNLPSLLFPTLTSKPSKKMNWNFILLIAILILLVYIAIKLTIKK